MFVDNSQRVPIKIWTDYVEPSAMEQARNLANLPFAHKHVALMPDCHCGYGMPIGGVLATEGVILPNAVGVDIGCGMCAVQTTLPVVYAGNIEAWKQVLGRIREGVPVGRNHHKEAQDERLMPKLSSTQTTIVEHEFASARRQLGTLGGGNHFIEIQKGSDGYIWVMIHSGSRNVGKKVADHYNKLAINLNERWHASIPKSHQLAFLPLDYAEGVMYRNEMEWCVEFAKRNRHLMMEEVLVVISDVLGVHPGDLGEEWIDIAHNYAALENHFGKNVWVHRKGATRTRSGELGIIPGSQGSKSYIVRGKGNRESFMSCSHGAGRVMSRSKARDELDMELEKLRMDEKGILHSIRGRSDLDEAPGAYKDIDQVMEHQKDLVDIVVTLEPIAVVKG